jgi:hypothetical protein
MKHTDEHLHTYFSQKKRRTAYLDLSSSLLAADCQFPCKEEMHESLAPNIEL